MDSTRASAIRLLTSSRSIGPPPNRGKGAETRADVAQLHSIIRRGSAPKPLSPPKPRRYYMLTRRQMIATTTFAGYAVAVDKVLAQAIKTDTDGLVAGDQVVKIGTYEMPVYEARPASGKDTPIVLVISEIWGVHEYIRDCTRRFAKAGYCAVAPELF